MHVERTSISKGRQSSLKRVIIIIILLLSLFLITSPLRINILALFIPKVHGRRRYCLFSLAISYNTPSSRSFLGEYSIASHESLRPMSVPLTFHTVPCKNKIFPSRRDCQQLFNPNTNRAAIMLPMTVIAHVGANNLLK